MQIFTTVNEACEMLNNEINPTSLQAWIRQGNCPLGVYIKKQGATRGSYKCFKDMVESAVLNGWKSVLNKE